jgi:hypothetical protein
VTEGLHPDCVSVPDAAGVCHVRQAGAVNVELRASLILSPAIFCAVLKLIGLDFVYRTLAENILTVFRSCHGPQCIGERSENYV